LRLKEIRKIQDLTKISYDYWLLISFGKVSYNSFDFYRELYIANVLSPVTTFGSIEGQDIFTIDVQESRAFLLKLGMVFDKEGWLLKKISKERKANLPVEKVNIL